MHDLYRDFMDTDATGTRPPFPFFAYYVLPHLSIILAIALPYFGLKLAVLCGVIATFFYSLRFDTGETFQNFSMGTAFATAIFRALDLLLLCNPMAEFRHNTQNSSLYELLLWKRLYHAICIFCNTRGIGWNYQVSFASLLSGERRS